jgi:4-amino-4-deoxy-L-arabinose transferase-like glycosyltransferase
VKRRLSKRQKKPRLPFSLTKETIVVAALLLLAFILRVIFLFQTKEIDPLLVGSDMQTYHTYAIQILNGTFPKEPYYYNPLYPYFMSFVYFIFGVNPQAVKIVQSILGVFTCFLVYLIGKKVFGQKVGLVSLLFSTMYGVFLAYEGTILIETLSCFLITLSLFLLLNPSFRRLSLAGISLGLASLTRANALIFIPFIFCWMMVEVNEPKRRITAKFGLLLLSLFFTILPVTIRNYIASGKFVLISTNGPINFWMGNNRYANGQYYTPTLPFQVTHAERIQQEVKEKGNKAYLEDVLDFARKEPLSYIKLQLKKFLLFFGTDEIANNTSYEWTRSIASVLRLPFIIDFSIIGPLGLMGLFFSLYKRKFGVWLLILFLFAYSISTTIFLVLSRYQLPVVPVFCVFSGFGLFSIYECLKKKDVRKLTYFLAVLIFFSCLLNANKGIAFIYPKIFRKGVFLETKEGLFLQDTSDIHRPGKGSGLLDSPRKSLKKELIIDRNPKVFGSAILFIDASIIPKKDAMLILKVNGKDFYTDISHRIHPKEEFITTRLSFTLESKLLKKGKNLFELKVTDDGYFSVPIDGSFCYKRSFFRDSESGEWKNIDGEYQISLWLEKILDKQK